MSKFLSQNLWRRLFEIVTLLVTGLVIALVIFNPFTSTPVQTNTPKPTSTSGLTATQQLLGDNDLLPGPVGIPRQEIRTVPQVSEVTPVVATPSNKAQLDLKVLVLAADGKEEDLSAIQQALDYIGLPYLAVKTAPLPQDPATDRLSAILSDGGNHAYFQGVILTTSNLIYNDGTNYASALTQTEWQVLHKFEASFNIRQINWYSSPTPEIGFQEVGTTLDTGKNPLSVQFTTAKTVSGKSLFSAYLNVASPLTIEKAYAYLAKPLDDANTFPLLTDSNGNALALVHNDSDGVQTLTLTFDSNSNLIHTIVLSYGLINWVTRGLYLGDFHTFLTVQPDDVLIGNYIWKVGAACSSSYADPSFNFYRMSGNDLKAFANWQKTQQARPTTPGLKIELPFVGIGTTGLYNPDTLTPMALQLKDEFFWVTHTYQHPDLDAVTYNFMKHQIEQNNSAAYKVGFVNPTNYSIHSLITPNVSGLKNSAALKGIYDMSIRYLVSNTSLPSYNNPSPNVGIYLNQANDFNLFLIPRHPSDQYFNVTSPDEWLAEDNCFYPNGDSWHVDNYQQIIDRESSILLTYLLKGDMDPLMFHQPNLRAYDGTHSLLSDLLDATLAKYNRYYTLPIISDGGQPIPKNDPLCANDPNCTQGAMDRLGYNMSKRTDYIAADVTATLLPDSSITLTANKDVRIPVTGLSLATTCPACSAVESYGGQKIVYVSLKAGHSVTLPIVMPGS